MLKKRCISQVGYTLIEVLIALVITGLLGAGILTALSQIRNVSNIDNAHMKAVKQTENAAHYLNRDIQMAQSIERDGVDQDVGEYWLELTWISWDGSIKSKAVYQLSGNQLRRKYLEKAPSDENYILFSSNVVANDISSTTATPPDPTALPPEKIWTIEITVNSASGLKQDTETRELKIIPRPGS